MTARINRRTLLAATAVVLPATALLSGPLAGSAVAASVPHLPDFAPVPAASFGPALNAAGYYVGQIQGDLSWVTDGFYQAMFLTTAAGVVLVDAPATIGHNLLRAIAETTRANGRPGKVTHLVYSHSHADHTGAAALFGNDVVRIGHEETRRLLRRAHNPNRPPPPATFHDGYPPTEGGHPLHLAYPR